MSKKTEGLGEVYQEMEALKKDLRESLKISLGLVKRLELTGEVHADNVAKSRKRLEDILNRVTEPTELPELTKENWKEYWGKECEFSYNGIAWTKGILVGRYNHGSMDFVTETNDYKHCRPIAKKGE